MPQCGALLRRTDAVEVAEVAGIGVREGAVREREGAVLVEDFHRAVARGVGREREGHLLERVGVDVAREDVPVVAALRGAVAEEVRPDNEPDT